MRRSGMNASAGTGYAVYGLWRTDVYGRLSNREIIPDFNDLVSRGNRRAALDRLHVTNNFREFTRYMSCPLRSGLVLARNAEPVRSKTLNERLWIVAGSKAGSFRNRRRDVPENATRLSVAGQGDLLLHNS